MKDLYDIWVLSRSYEFAGDSLARAIRATFARRKTEIPVDVPDALTAAFANDPAKQRQWTAFVEGIEAQPVRWPRSSEVWRLSSCRMRGRQGRSAASEPIPGKRHHACAVRCTVQRSARVKVSMGGLRR